MIESNILEWLDFNDSTQNIDVYSKFYLVFFFKFFRTLLKNKPFPNIIYIILKIVSFIQLLSISSIIIYTKNDIILEIFYYLNNTTLLFDIISSNKSFFQLFIAILIIIIIDILLMIFILFTMKLFEITLIIYIINFINTIIYYYLIGPAIEICLFSFLCEDGNQKIYNLKCYSNPTHYKYKIISIIIMLFYILISFLYAKYFNEIGSISTNINEKFIRINSKYEIFCLISKIFIFAFYYFYRIKNNSYLISLLYETFIFFISISMFIYVNKYLYYNNNAFNYINYFGWFFISWFSFFLSFKILFDLNNISLFIIIGWILIIFLVYKNNTLKEFKLLAETNIFDISNIKSIEIFKNNILKILSDKNNIKSKVALHGIIKNCEEYINNNPEINYHYQKLINDKYLNSKYNNFVELPILSIIYIIYITQLEKASNKDEIALYMSYFLINELKNWGYAIFLLSKIKPESHMILYYKYLLMEEIKDNLIAKLNKKTNNNSIKHIQIGKSILYYLYLDLFKIKIYDAICNQIDYFEKLKDNNGRDKHTENFLKTGKYILKIRNQIKIIWDKLITLNPFSDEPYKDYNLYLNSIIQDEILSKEEEKRYKSIKKKKINEKLNAYYSIFLIDISSTLLANGDYTNGKILYASPNFPLVFNYNIKELLNLTIEDLLPNVVQSFHKELIDDAIKYSNINYIYKKQINSLLKSKNGSLFSIKLFVKLIPNLKYGLTFCIYLQKIIDSNFIIVLDKDFRINGFSHQIEGNPQFSLMGRYNLSQGLYGYHIGMIIPEILTMLEYKNDEFDIIKKNQELKGYIYQMVKIKDVKNIVDIILEKIKGNTININNIKIIDKQIQAEDNFQSINEEFNILIKELSKENINPFSIFYKVIKYSFLDGKYKYYKIYINDDIITANKNAQIIKQGDDIGTKRSKNTDLENSESSSKKSDIKNKKIRKKIIDKAFNINENKDEISNIEEINEVINKKEITKKIENDNNEEKMNNNKSNNNLSPFDIQSSNSYRRLNKIKSDIIYKKEIFPIRIMKYLCFIFGILTIIFMLYNQKSLENAFNYLSLFLDENIFFNMTKMTVAVLYITSINIKWQLHSCNLTSFYNMSSLYEGMLIENINYLGWIKDFTNNLDIYYQKKLLQKYEVEFNIYGIDDKEKYSFDFDNLLTYFVNSEINLLKEYPTLIEELNKTKNQSISPLIFGINELDNLVEQTYNFFNSGIKGFQKEEKDEKIRDIFQNLLIWFIPSSIILIIILGLYIFFTLRLNLIETVLVNKLININSNNLEIYINQFNEIKDKKR